MAEIPYDKLFHESTKEAVTTLKTVGGFGKPGTYEIAKMIFYDKLCRLRNAEQSMVLADTLAKQIGKINTNVSSPIYSKSVDDARERAQASLRAEKERFEKLEREFAESFGQQ